jgi:hypothetical protein
MRGDHDLNTPSERPEQWAGLSDHDARHLAALEQRLQVVRDHIAEVVHGYVTGFYLFGEGGVGKSYTVIEELQRLKADFKVFNSRMTGRGLYNALERFPDSVHVLEDMEPIFRDRGAQGVLRSALWGQRKDGGRGAMERTVTWSTCNMEHSFIFTGGIIMTANKPLAELPELMALRTRIGYVQFRATDAELTALMRSAASKGYEHRGQAISPAECSEVCEFIVEESRSLHRSLDMRLLVNGFMDLLAWRECDAGCHWRDMVATRLKQRPINFDVPPAMGTRAERKQAEQAIAREIAEVTPDRHERLRLWRERTGKSEATFYRRLAETGGPDSQFSVDEN